MTEDLAHRNGGACAGDRPAGGSLQLERKGLKEVGRGATFSGIKPLGLSVAFRVTSLSLTLLQTATSGFAKEQGQRLGCSFSHVPLD